MRYAQIESGQIVNVIEAERADIWEGVLLVPDPDGLAVIGGSWSEEGGFVAPPETEPEIIVPQSVTPLQARRALRQAGIKAEVDAYVATLDEEAQEAWEYALAIERNNPIVVGAGAALGMTEQQIDDLFILAATL